MGEDFEQQWHRVLSERNRLQGELEKLITAQQRHHDDHHDGPARWCDVPPCRLLFTNVPDAGWRVIAARTGDDGP
ncbi:hypothetical protein [Amycolatopsis sp. NPDC051071]|uniref:hypothetical protein n=1 Tax=Amycolatopsis sp. NPDC051071 TaxID=3154637 RepID=UPI00341D6780